MRYKEQFTFWIITSLLALLSSAAVEGQTPIDLMASSATGNNGETVTIDITTSNFDVVAGLQFSVFWDTDVLQYSDITNLNSDLDIMPSSFSLDSDGNIVIPGELLFNWSSLSGFTLDDGTVLFSVELDVIGSPCDESDIVVDEPSNAFQTLEVLKIVEGNFVDVGANVSNGLFNIPGQNCDNMGEGDVTFIAANRTADPGEEVCVSITVQNFIDVTSAGFTLTYDPSVIEYGQIRNANLPGLSGSSFNLVSPGELRFSWSSTTGSGLDRSDGATIFDVCFTVVGANGTSTSISFSNADVGIDDNGTPVNVIPETTNGSVIVGDGAFDGLEFNLGNVTLNEGEEFCIPVVVRNFEDITSFSYEVNFNENLIEFVELRSFNLAFLSEANFNTTTADNGEIRTFWFDENVTGVSVDDNTVIFEYCFVALGDCPTSTTLDNNPGFSGFEALDPQSEEVPFLIRSAEIEIICGFNIDPVIQEESCGDACDGSIALNIDGGVAPFDIEWSGPTTVADDQMVAENLCPGTYDVVITADNGFSIDTSFVIESPNTFDISDIDIEDEFLGSDGSILLTISGGSGDFSFDWSTTPSRQGNPIEDLNAGTYTVTVTDNESGCELVSGEISVDLIFVVEEIQVTNVSCPTAGDGSAIIILAGGSGDFSFNWDCSNSESNSAEGLDGGECEVVITDNETGLSITRSFTIEEDAPITIGPDITNDDSGDESGAIILNVSGGSSPYTFGWSNGETTADISNLGVGLYFVTVTDANDCSAEFGPIPITDGSLLLSITSSIEEFNGNGVSCFGNCDGFIEIEVFGGEPPYSIEWNDGNGFELNPLCAGTYEYTITDADDLVEEGSIELTEPEEIEVDIVNLECSENNDGSIELEGVGGSAPYEYSFDGINFSSENVNTNLSTGSYNVFVRDANGCEVMIPYEINRCSDGDCYEAIPVITPNDDGRNDQFIIRCADDRDNTLEVFNRMGQLVFEQDNYRNTWEGTDLSGGLAPEGSYMWVLIIPTDAGGEEIHKGTVTILRKLR